MNQPLSLSEGSAQPIEWQDFPRANPGQRVTRQEMTAPAPFTGCTGLEWYCHADGVRVYPASPLDSVLRGFDLLTIWSRDRRFGGYGFTITEHLSLGIQLAEYYAAERIQSGEWTEERGSLFIRGFALHEGGEAIIKDQITMTKRLMPAATRLDNEWTAAIAHGAGVDWLARAASGDLTLLDADLRDALRHIDLLAMACEMVALDHVGRWDVPPDVWIEPTESQVELARIVSGRSVTSVNHNRQINIRVIWRAIWRDQEVPDLGFCFMTAHRKRFMAESTKDGGSPE